ncbi:hypothetical protein GGR56DRAFT_246720 [Xylariaceae sp. FL0804]|nr:hypothetical protein GGR56DRAFT_246720 [Xylariaceae sp. FL0804]
MPGTGGDGDNNRPGGEPPGMASSSQPVASGEPATSPSNRPGGVSPSSPSPGATVAVGGSHDYLRSIDEAVEFAMSRGLGIAISVPNGNLFTVPNMVLADDWSVGVHMLRELAARIERHVQGTDDNNGDPEFAGIGSSGGGASAYGNVGNTGGLASGKDDQGIRGPDPERTQVRPQAKTPKKVHYEELSTGPSTPEPRLRGLAASRWNQPGTGINSSSDNIPSRRSSKAATTPDQTCTGHVPVVSRRAGPQPLLILLLPSSIFFQW